MTSIFRRKGRRGVTLKYRDATGKLRMKTFPNRGAAEERALDLRLAPDPGRSITLAVYARVWLGHMAARLRPGTHSQYRHGLENHLLPALGHLKLTEITRGHIKDLIAEKLKAGLSRSTVSNVHVVLHGCLAEAVEDGYLFVNPAAAKGRSKALRLLPPRNERAMTMKAMDRDQLGAFLVAAEKVVPDRALMFRVAAMTGLRLGELLALHWEDVDFAARTLRVERSWSRQRMQAPKTQASIRDVDLPTGLLEQLRARDKETRAAALETGRPRAALLFPSRAGRPFFHGPVGQDFKRATAAAGLSQRLTPHCLRHTFASIHLQAGESVYYVSRQMGHASIKMTVDRYGRWLPAGNAAAANRLEAAVSPVSPGPIRDAGPILSPEHTRSKAV